MKLSFKILIHSIYWLVFLALSISLTGFAKNENPAWPVYAWHLLIDFAWAVVIFYSYYRYFVKYYERGRFLIYFLISVATSALAAILILFTFCFILEHESILNWENWGAISIGSFIISQCGSLIRGFENWTDYVTIEKELTNRNLQNELVHLKQQINPHFLFNSLNNIDALIYKSPDDASESLNRLAKIFRYMVYETNVERVPLQNDLAHIKNYIELQALRFNNPSFVKSNLPIDCRDVQIAPMLFLPFVENAFKYASNQGSFPVVEINVQLEAKILRFKCINGFQKTDKIQKSAGGVGLENVKQRLKLIYPNKHKLDLVEHEPLFTVNLEIDFS